MMSLTFGLFTQVSDSGPQDPLVVAVATTVLNGFIPNLQYAVNLLSQKCHTQNLTKTGANRA